MNAPKTRSGRTRSEAAPHPAREPTPKPLETSEIRLVLLAAGAVALFLYFIRAILLPFLLAAIVAYICTPFLDWATKRTRLPRLLLAIVLFVVLVGIGAFAVTFAAQRLVVETTSTANELQSMLENLAQQALGSGSIHIFGQSMDAGQIVQALLDRMRDYLGQPDLLAIMTGYSIASLMGAFLTVVLFFYFLVSGRTVANGLLWIVPPHRRALVLRIWHRLDPALTRYFLGMIVVVIYATIASYIGLGVILGIDHAVLLALLTGVLETVPVIGSTSAAIIAGLISLRTATGLISILDYALYATALRLSIDQVVGPIVLGRAAHVHPVLIIFCFLAGAVLLGIPGVILAVPMALVIKNALAILYGEDVP